MSRWLPYSLGFFFVALLAYAVQLIPIVGIFFSLMLAMFWSIPLINGGMIGIAMEALAGRVSRVWLIVPLAFYGGYYAMMAQEQVDLTAQRAAYQAMNARVSIPFDDRRQALGSGPIKGLHWG